MSNNLPINLGRFDNKDYEYPKHLVLLNNKLVEASLTPKRVIVSIPPRHGKLLANDTLVLTPNGFKKHGDLKVNDYVYNQYGKPIKILAVSNKDYANYEITFTDGSKFVTHPNHEWQVYDILKKNFVILETKQMIEKGLFVGKHSRFLVANKPVIEFKEQKTIINPYVFGVWLGDGSTSKNCITIAKNKFPILEKFKELGYEVTGNTSNKDNVHSIYFKKLYKDLVNLGFIYKKKKHVPKEYIYNSYENRLLFLAGLIDTDGTIDKNGRIRFVNTNKHIIQSLYILLNSLGVHVSIHIAEPKISTYGIVGKKKVYTIGFNPNFDIPLQVHKQVNKDFLHRKRGIRSIKLVKAKQGNCIQVEGGIYLIGKNLIPTHNSELISKYFPAWYLCNFPNNRLMLITASNKFSENFGRKIRELVRAYAKYYKSNVILNDSSQSVSEFAFNNYVGEFYGVGAGSANIIGKGANFMIIDDPISDISKVINPNQRDKMFEWFQSDIFNRLEPNGSIFLVMQRWHIDDLAGRLLKSGVNWEYIELPALANENDILGRELNEPLWSERYDTNSLNEIKLQMGDFWFNAKYQQKPMLNESSIFNSDLFNYYDNENDFEFIYLSYDTAFKTGNANDFTACVILGFKNDKIYILDSYKSKLQYPELKIKVENDYKKYKPQMVLIEDKASGQSLIQDLRRNTSIPIKAIKVENDKILRANIASMQMNKVYFNSNKNKDLISELITFPYDLHDDMVDAFTQGVNYMKKLSSTPNVLTL